MVVGTQITNITTPNERIQIILNIPTHIYTYIYDFEREINVFFRFFLALSGHDEGYFERT